jgi:two-component system, OmpR family, sensor kinase
MKPSALPRRLWRSQLRLRVLAGVVIVTLLAIVAFDIGAVATMRKYLLAQTDQNLQVALELTRIQLPLLVPGYPPQAAAVTKQGRKGSLNIARGGAGTSAVTPKKASPQLHSLLGEFDIAYLPQGGTAFQLEVGAYGPAGQKLVLPANIARLTATAGPRTVFSPNGRIQIRVNDIQVAGGTLVAGTGLYQVDKTMNRAELIIAVGSIAVVLLIGAGVFLVLRRGLRPIESMAAQADRITAGDLTERVIPHGSRSEVGRLGSALNGMLARIEADVHEREASQERVRRFFGDASHELRTPLASLRANAELYQQGAVTSPDQVDEVMRRIAIETRRMGRLVDDMLRLARLGLHPGQSREPVDVTSLAQACAERVRIADPARTWQVRIDKDLVTTGDEELLRRAVDNLLMNVLVHTPPETAAALTAYGDDEAVIIEVRDDGPGVPPDKLPHIFERFYRAAGARSGRPGSGLGLAIAAEIAAAHGGIAEAALVSPHGLGITLTLSRSEPAAQPNDPSTSAISGLNGPFTPVTQVGG